MEQITWTEDFSVGVVRFDEHHKRLVSMINRLIADPRATTKSETISDLLGNMTIYAIEHFAAEEELMVHYNYPDIEKHVAQHRAFQKKTVDFCLSTMLNVETIPEKMLQYLRGWIVQHMLQSDMAYKPFFREQGIE